MLQIGDPIYDKAIGKHGTLKDAKDGHLIIAWRDGSVATYNSRAATTFLQRQTIKDELSDLAGELQRWIG